MVGWQMVSENRHIKSGQEELNESEMNGRMSIHGTGVSDCIQKLERAADGGVRNSTILDGGL